MKIIAYVDGESHWHRSMECWRQLHGPRAQLASVHQSSASSVSYPHGSGDSHVLVNPDGKLFWDCSYGNLIRAPLTRHAIQDAVYFTDFAGSTDDLHALKVLIRNHGFDPQVIPEIKQLADRRKQKLDEQRLIEKPKGVDIGLTVRLLEDANSHAYDVCYLFTSDVDYVPVIQAVQRTGRRVVVFGYGNGLGNNSQLQHVPHQFIDLGDHMKANCNVKYDCAGSIESFSGELLYKSVSVTIVRRPSGTWGGKFTFESAEPPRPFEGWLVTRSGSRAKLRVTANPPAPTTICEGLEGPPPDYPFK